MQAKQVALVGNHVRDFVLVAHSENRGIGLTSLRADLRRHAEIAAIGETKTQHRVGHRWHLFERNDDEVDRLNIVNVDRSIVVPRNKVLFAQVLIVPNVANGELRAFHFRPREPGILG